MFNVYKNQLSRQTGSRNLTGPKTLPTIWHTYMKLVSNIRFLPSIVAEKNLTKNILDGWKDGRTARRTEVKQYTPLWWSGGIIIVVSLKQQFEMSYSMLFTVRNDANDNIITGPID